MEKEKITFEQLAAGAILKFGKLESADMTLLMMEFSKFAEIAHDNNDDLDKYFVMGDGSVLLNEDYVYKFYGHMHDSLIDMVKGSIVEQYFSKLNVTQFVLRKIKLIGLGFVVKDGLRDTFSKRQIDSMEELYERGFIEDYMQEDFVYGDYEAIRITQKGRLALFLADNRSDLVVFLKVLRNAGYSDRFLNEFLLSQDLDKPCETIISIDNFMEYCNNNSKKEYRRTKNPRK